MGRPRLDLGVGLVSLGGVDLLWTEIADLVDVLEVEPQTLWQWDGAGGPRLNPAALRWCKNTGRPLLSHGVGYPVGGTVPPDLRGVRAAAKSARELDAVHWSEHLSFNQAQSDRVFHAGFLLPPIPTETAVTAAVSNIARYQDQLDLPFLVETPASYLRRTPGDLRDGEFVREVSEGADCGILLDLHNVWANELNGRQKVLEFVDELPLERVWELHLAGGMYLDGYYLDAHCGGVAPELLELAALIVPRLHNLRAILFEAIPVSLMALGAPGLRRVLTDLHHLADLPEIDAATAPARTSIEIGAEIVTEIGTGTPRGESAVPVPAPVSTARRESLLAAYTTRAGDEVPDADPGAVVLRRLTDEARLSLVAGADPERLSWMFARLGRERTDALMAEFLTAGPATIWPADVALDFARWFDEHRDGWQAASEQNQPITR
jgi:uncharacterized protein